MGLNEIIEILGVRITKSPIEIDEYFKVHILFEIKKQLKERIKINFIYVQSPDDNNKDQELEVYEIPGDRLGKFKVNFSVNPPSFHFSENLDSFGITLFLIQFGYKKHEFTRVGYYVNNELNGPVERDSERNLFVKTKFIQRNILIDEPRVTKFFHEFK